MVLGCLIRVMYNGNCRLLYGGFWYGTRADELKSAAELECERVRLCGSIGIHSRVDIEKEVRTVPWGANSGACRQAGAI